ncbi:MAG: TIGR02679 family protein [Actinoallomurus sp.]
MDAATAIDGFRAEAYRRLFAAARRSLERTGGDLSGHISVAEAGVAERDAIAGLTGKRLTAGAKRVRVGLGDLDADVRRAAGLGLAALLETIGPKLRDRPAESAADAGARTDMRRVVQASPLYAAGWYRAWLDGLGGTLTKLITQGETDRLAQAVRVLEFLDARREETITIPELASAITRDTKALDHRRTLSRLVLGALATRAGVAPPERAEQRRELWDTFGVVADDLASRVLVLDLPAEGEGLGEWLTGAARHGTPFQVTLHQLRTLPIRVRPRGVYVCENPAILRRAAGDLGPSSAPLLCTEGLPSSAFHHLAQAITGGGGELRYHGDFDWPGIAIADAVIRRHGATPWRMSAADYRDGLGDHTDHVTLGRTARTAPWAPGLAEAMTDAGAAVYEEAVADRLIADLRDAEPPAPAGGPSPARSGT